MSQKVVKQILLHRGKQIVVPKIAARVLNLRPGDTVSICYSDMKITVQKIDPSNAETLKKLINKDCQIAQLNAKLLLSLHKDLTEKYHISGKTKALAIVDHEKIEYLF